MLIVLLFFVPPLIGAVLEIKKNFQLETKKCTHQKIQVPETTTKKDLDVDELAFDYRKKNTTITPAELIRKWNQLNR